MPQRLSIPLLRFMYIFCRERTKRVTVNVNNGGRMSEEDYLKAMEEVKSLTMTQKG